MGPFDVFERIGRGGMGEVFRGVHVGQNVPVALKIVAGERAQHQKYRRAFRNEVHAMARLDHPGVVMVFDVGEVPELNDTRFNAGSPFVAMELATHGTLGRLRKGLHWRRLRSALYSILDALGHAHARGVIHRDLKPGNVLLTSRGALPAIKLADFGLAYAMFSSGLNDEIGKKISGTPRYMAPEQIEGKWRDQGPWTDLYALGCLVHWLINGEPPFSGELNDILSGHLFDEPPSLDSPFELPGEFHTWTRRLLSKRIASRYRRASDAAFDLMRMKLPSAVSGEFEFEGFGGGLEEITNQNFSQETFGDLSRTIETSAVQWPSQGWRQAAGFSATILDVPLLERLAGSDSLLAPVHAPVPIPETWERPGGGRRSMPLIGAGLGLYGVRSIPLAGRHRERTQIWDALKDVHSSGGTRAVVLRGAAGNGKTRLAEWITERAHETGAGSILRATHGRTQGPTDGLARMLGRFLQIRGLSRSRALERIKQRYFEGGAVDGPEFFDCVVLSEMCVPAGSDEEDQIRFLSPTERFTVIARFLARIARERPVVLWLDDAQWGVESLEFVSFLQTSAAKLAAMVLLTVRNEAVIPDSLEERLLARIADHEHGKDVAVGTLDSVEHVRLVEDLLSLESHLAHEVALRTDGNPLFAVQLVGDWVQRGALTVSSDGFVLAEGESAEVPKSIREVWSGRVQRLTQGFSDPTQARTLLEAAAVLGDEVDTREWAVTAIRLQVEALPSLVEKMVELRLARRTELGWTFWHGMLRETLLSEIQSPEILIRYHQVAASTLRELYPLSQMKVLERIAIHLVEAGDHGRALAPLYAAASWRNQTCDFDVVRRLLDRHCAALEALNVAESDERWGQNWLIHISSLLRQGLVDDSEALLIQGNELAERFGWTCHPEFVMRRASLARKRGNTDDASLYYARAYDLFDTEEGRGRCVYGIAETLLFRGHVDEALEKFKKARSHLRPSHEGYALVLIGLAGALMRSNCADEAYPLLVEAVARFQEIGNRNGAASALNSLGELERVRGDFEAAGKAYERAVKILVSIGSRGVIIPGMNLGLVNIAQAQWAAARDILEDGLNVLVKSGERSHMGLVYVALLPCVAAMSDWDAWDTYWDEAVAILSKNAWVDHDIAHHAELAADIALEKADAARGMAALNFALEQWKALDNRVRVSALEAKRDAFHDA